MSTQAVRLQQTLSEMRALFEGASSAKDAKGPKGAVDRRSLP
jgi:hypothetical protein